MKDFITGTEIEMLSAILMHYNAEYIVVSVRELPGTFNYKVLLLPLKTGGSFFVNVHVHSGWHVVESLRMSA